MQCGGGGPEKTRVYFRVLAHVETFWRRKGKFSLFVSISIVRLDDVGGIEDGSLRSLLIIAGLRSRGSVVGIVSSINQALFLRFWLFCLPLLEVL